MESSILDYVKKNLSDGFTSQQIKAALATQGWNEEEIDKTISQAFKELSATREEHKDLPEAPKKITPILKKSNKLTATQILLYLGGTIVVIAGISYVTISWSQWNPFFRIFAIFLPLAITYATGAFRYHDESKKGQSAIFFFVSAFLFPIFLIVLFRELELFKQDFSSVFNLTLSLLSLLFYIFSALTFRHTLWTLLSHLFVIPVYYFIFRVLEIPSVFSEDTLAWLLLLPATVYLILSPLYEVNKLHKESNQVNVIAILLVIFCLQRVFAGFFIEEQWLNVCLAGLLGIGYFLLGAIFEKRGFEKNHGFPYFLGTILVIASVVNLLSDKEVLNALIGSADRDAKGWAGIIAGLILIGMGYLVSKLGAYGFPKAKAYKEFYNFVGPFWILGSVFYLGLGGNEPVYETLLLILSLVFIFASIPKQASQYIMSGTVFLLIYIFSMGGEYFQDEIGWPLTLFVTGIGAMLTSVLIERIRRKYFKKTS